MNKYTAMIVDDSDIDRYLLKRFLSQTEMIEDVYEEIDGYDAFQTFNEYVENADNVSSGFPPSILFLDVNMPRMNGFEFLDHYSQLKAKNDSLHCCIIMFTSSDTLEDKERAFSFNCVKDYLDKSNYTAETLKQKIVQHLEAC